MKKQFFSLMAIFALLFSLSAPNALASYENGNDYFMDSFSKLGRSAWNIATSPAAVPCGINNELKESENNFVDFFVGIGKGTVTALNRLGTGAFEAVTFWYPTEPLLPVNNVCSDA